MSQPLPLTLATKESVRRRCHVSGDAASCGGGDSWVSPANVVNVASAATYGVIAATSETSTALFRNTSVAAPGPPLLETAASTEGSVETPGHATSDKLSDNNISSDRTTANDVFAAVEDVDKRV
ncbi:hypothetical protein MTO96_020772 [Rhipicephalus appendiculatus]